MTATGLIAEDEPLLAASLRATLGRLWPQLQIVAMATHGTAAVEDALARRPDIVFLDIRMPGMSGLEAAELLVEEWPGDAPLPLIVFVTAYDQYAVRAFEHAAVDYVLKPVEADRLALTCSRLKAALAARRPVSSELPPDLLAALAALRSAGPPVTPTRLRVLQASLGATIHMVPVAEVLYFKAADKYIKVVTATREYLIRLPLRQLIQQLDPAEFWQIHRGTVVRADVIATAVRDDMERVELTLRGHPARLAVSRLYTHLFRAM